MNWLKSIWYKYVCKTSRNSIKVQNYADTGTGLFEILHAEAEWRKVRNAYIITDNKCNVCGVTKDLEVHHVKPWHLFPALRYDFANLITLCKCCHFRFGHGKNWRHWNPQIRELCVAVRPFLSSIKSGANYE